MANSKSPPAQQVIDSSKNKDSNTISFPEDLGDYYVSVQFYDYRTWDRQPSLGSNDGLSRNIYSADKGNIKDAIAATAANKNLLQRLALPLPLQLRDSFSVGWQETELGLFATTVSETLQAISRGFKSSQDALPQLDTNLKGQEFIQQVKQWGGTTPGQFALAILREGLGQDKAALIDLSTGVAVNPNLTLLFRGPTLKTHNFSWKFSARTAEESARIRKIISIFKRGMHPSRLNSTTPGFLKYPSECLVEFHGPKSNFLYPLRPTVVADLEVNYAPNNVPAFFSGTDEPVIVEIAVRFQETSYYLRDSFDNDKEYGSDGLETQNLLQNSLPTDGSPGDITS